MKRILLLIFLLIQFSFANADGNLKKIYEIIKISDFCFYGEIIEISDYNFRIRIESSYFEDTQEKEIVITDYKYREFQYQWNYSIGQKLIVFLKKSNHFGYPFEFENRSFLGRENEFVLEGDSLYNIINFRKGKFYFQDFINAITDYKHNYLAYKDLFDAKFLEYRLQNQYNLPFIFSSKDTVLNFFSSKSNVHKFIMNQIFEHYEYLLNINKNRHVMFEKILIPFVKSYLFYNEENPFLINNIEGWIFDSISFVGKNIEIHQVKDKLVIKPLKVKNCSLFVIHNYKGMKDTLSIINFDVFKSSDPTISVKYIVCSIMKYNFGSHVFLINRNILFYNDVEIISYKMNIYSKDGTYSFVSKRSLIPREAIDKIKTLKKNDIVEIEDIIAVDVFGKPIYIKPVKYKIKKFGQFCKY